MNGKVEHEINCYPTLKAVEYALPQELTDKLQEGSVLWKVRSFEKWYRRKYSLNLEAMQLVYDWSHKMPCLTEPVFHNLATAYILGDTYHLYAYTYQKFELSEIQDVRKGWKTDTFNKFGTRMSKYTKKHPDKRPPVDEMCCFSIIHGIQQSRTLDLVAPSEEVCDTWVCGLQQIVSTEKSIAYKRGYELWLKKQFKMADKDNTGTLNFVECLELMKQLNISVSVQHARKYFKEANVNNNVRGEEEVLDEFEFVEFYRSLLHRPELSEIMRSYGKHHTEMMGPEELQTFGVDEQKLENLNLDLCKALIKAYESENTENPEKKLLTLGGFRLLLLSEDHDIFNIRHRSIYQDMSRPMHDYYIASSHNTYLMGSQLIGHSSVEAYINALKRGCRTIELDLWDGDDGEPIIFHGYTLTTKISLREVLHDALRPYAFQTSEYPLILSLENHCSAEQQRVAATLFSTILGGDLYTFNSELDCLPSPESLKRKFLLKAKKLSEIHEDMELGDVRNGGNSDSETELDVELNQPSDGTTVSYPKIVSRQVSTELSDLIALRSAKFQGFEFHRTKGRCTDMISFAENKTCHLISETPEEFIEHNQRQLVRIYPGGGRTDSSNLNPIPMWNYGCQIVSLNYQTEDESNLINMAKFMQNGNCGYVLKPKFLCKGDYEPRSPIGSEVRKFLTIRVISGQHIPKPEQRAEGEVVDPYVIIRVHGHCDDNHTVQTKEIHNNGFNPMWNESFTFSIRVPELAFVHFVVRDQCNIGKDEKLGEYVLPFTSIQQGYRHVHLVDIRGNSIVPASLFVHVKIADA